MNALQISPAKNAAHFIQFSHPKSKLRNQGFRISSCHSNATNDFRNELLSAANSDQVKKAYRKMALRYHPDVCDPSVREESTRLFIELQSVYKSLVDNETQQTGGTESSALREKWEIQLSELKRKSNGIKEQTEGTTWGSRMRAKHQ